jgi:hypothetical protein
MPKLKPAFFAVLSTVFLNLFALATQAQRQLPLELTWKKGTVVLTSGDTVRGGVVLSSPNDQIRIIAKDSSTSFYSPVDVNYFDVSELSNNVVTNKGAASEMEFNFHYQVFPWNHDRDYSNFISPSFFIEMEPGKYSLLMRLEKVQEGPTTPTSMASAALVGGLAGAGLRKLIEQILEEKLYIKLPGDKVIALRKPESDIKRLFPNQYEKISNYAQENQLGFRKAQDLAEIVGYINDLNR